MTTRKVLCLLALPVFLICGEAAAKGNKGNGTPQAQAAKSSTAKQVPATARTNRRQPNNIGTGCPPFACGTDSNGPQLTGIQSDAVQELDKLATNGRQLSGLQAASGPAAVSAVTLASGEAIALR